jgi:hypothetical protein
MAGVRFPVRRPEILLFPPSILKGKPYMGLFTGLKAA